MKELFNLLEYLDPIKFNNNFREGIERELQASVLGVQHTIFKQNLNIDVSIQNE